MKARNVVNVSLRIQDGPDVIILRPGDETDLPTRLVPLVENWRYEGHPALEITRPLRTRKPTVDETDTETPSPDKEA